MANANEQIAANLEAHGYAVGRHWRERRERERAIEDELKANPPPVDPEFAALDEERWRRKPIDFSDMQQPAGLLHQLYRDYRTDNDPPRRAFERAFVELVKGFPKLSQGELEHYTKLWWDLQVDVEETGPELGWDALCSVVRKIWPEIHRKYRRAIGDLGGFEFYLDTGEPVEKEPEGGGRGRNRSNRRTVRGVRYRGAKRDRSADPYYVFTPANVVTAVEEERLDASVIPYASVLYQHIRRSERYKDKGKRITCAELGRKLHRSERSAKRAIAAMVGEGELQVVSPGRGNRNGTIYRFPPRSER